MAYRSPLDIWNRALQLLDRPSTQLLENSAQFYQMNLAYEQVREFELERNLWTFATRRQVLRPISPTTVSVSFPAYAAGTTYTRSAIVSYNNGIWISTANTNLGHTPGDVPASGVLYWENYFGPVTAELWSGNANVPSSNDEALPGTYHIGDLVYTTPGDGTYSVYISLVDDNDETPASPDVWDDAEMYSINDVVTGSDGTNYQSLVALNYNYDPAAGVHPTQWTTTVTASAVSSSWLKITSATVVKLRIVYPYGVGPVTDVNSRNAFHKPNGFLKPAPPEPKRGQIPYLGGPTGITMPDWNYEGDYIISEQGFPILIRFVASIQDVTTMHPMFCEGMASALGLNVGPSLGADLNKAQYQYNRIMKDARTMNAIEMSSVTVPDDEWISVRY